MSRFVFKARGCAATAALALTLPTGSAVAGTLTTSVMIPLDDTVYVQTNQTPEWVNLVGRLHVVTQVVLPGDACIPTDPCREVRTRVRAILAEVGGIGQTTGETYRATGATRFETTVSIPGALALQGGFRLHPPNPIIPQGETLSVNLNIALDETGQMSEVVAPASLVSWWPGEGDALDRAGRNPGEAGEGVTFVPGRVGQAFGFDTTDFVTVPGSASLEPATVSILAWVRAEATPGGFAYILSKGAQSCTAASYAVYTGASGGLQFYISDGQHFDLSPDAGVGVWDNEWHQVAGTYDGSMVRLYVDGVEVESGTPAVLTDVGYALERRDLYLGAYRSADCDFRFRGAVDEVQVYSRALSAEEIAAIYAAAQ